MQQPAAEQSSRFRTRAPERRALTTSRERQGDHGDLGGLVPVGLLSEDDPYGTRDGKKPTKPTFPPWARRIAKIPAG